MPQNITQKEAVEQFPDAELLAEDLNMRLVMNGKGTGAEGRHFSLMKNGKCVVSLYPTTGRYDRKSPSPKEKTLNTPWTLSEAVQHFAAEYAD